MKKNHEVNDQNKPLAFEQMVKQGADVVLNKKSSIASKLTYTLDEKVVYMKKYVLAKQMKKNALSAGVLLISDEALRKIITEYTASQSVAAGGLVLGQICKKVARHQKLLRTSSTSSKCVFVSVKNLTMFLGSPRYEKKLDESQNFLQEVKEQLVVGKKSKNNGEPSKPKDQEGSSKKKMTGLKR